jgi:hypothetical protein
MSYVPAAKIMSRERFRDLALSTLGDQKRFETPWMRIDRDFNGNALQVTMTGKPDSDERDTRNPVFMMKDDGEIIRFNGEYCHISGHLEDIAEIERIRRAGQANFKRMDKHLFVDMARQILRQEPENEARYEDAVMTIEVDHLGDLEIVKKAVVGLEGFEEEIPVTVQTTDGTIVRHHGHHAYLTQHMHEVIGSQAALQAEIEARSGLAPTR